MFLHTKMIIKDSISKIVRRSSINENADATIKGVEAEFTFFVTNTLMLDGFYAWTDATIDSFLTVDPLNPNGATLNIAIWTRPNRILE